MRNGSDNLETDKIFDILDPANPSVDVLEEEGKSDADD
jgi:hypothetical protein